jgi:AmmeMemoRadiSam system protein A
MSVPPDRPDGDPAVLGEPPPSAVGSAEQGRILLVLAREAIAVALGAPAPAAQLPPAALAAAWLLSPGACFVTLTREGRLRGCIGSVQARRPLLEDLRSNARAAALADPRFPPLAVAELPVTRIEVSLLSPAAPLPAASEEEALAVLRPGVDGVILEYGFDLHATFLPQVWENLPRPRDFLAQLRQKAGLPPDFWSPEIRLQRYSVEKWSEPERT